MHLLFGKAGRLGKPLAFHFDASAFLSLGGGEEASIIPCFWRCEVWFHRTRLRPKRAPEGRERQMARGVKFKFQDIPYRLGEVHVISLCAYRRYLQTFENWQTASIFSKCSMSFKHNDITSHVEPNTDCTHSLKHNDIRSNSGANTACQAFAISECELTCLVAWPWTFSFEIAAYLV